jgi:vesicle coat complex subunit
LCSNLDELDEPDAKASLIWIIGEYAEKIENADELLAIFLDGFKEESYAVSQATVADDWSSTVQSSSGSIANRDSDCQTVLEETGSCTGNSAASFADCHQGLG